jgi:hypothetical protein
MCFIAEVEFELGMLTHLSVHLNAASLDMSSRVWYQDDLAGTEGNACTAS